MSWPVWSGNAKSAGDGTEAARKWKMKVGIQSGK
jgi:hypothetical protein